MVTKYKYAEGKHFIENFRISSFKSPCIEAYDKMIDSFSNSQRMESNLKPSMIELSTALFDDVPQLNSVWSFLDHKKDQAKR